MAKKELAIKIKEIPTFVKGIAALITAGGVIFAAVHGAVSTINDKITEQVEGRIATVKEEALSANQSTQDQLDGLQAYLSETGDKNTLSMTRIELMLLIYNEPENITEIERVASYYFNAGGDWYMSGLYTRWAKTYGGDASFVKKD